MLSGFNTNYRHRGVVFHVQTEDSGLAHPHVITHLFHGGNIVASRKSAYADKLGAADLESEVRALMERQHKEMLLALRRGDHDETIVARLGAGIFGDATDRGGARSDAAPDSPPEDVEVTEGGPAGKTDILVTYLYKVGFRLYEMGSAAAVSVIVFLILLIFAVAYTSISWKEIAE